MKEPENPFNDLKKQRQELKKSRIGRDAKSRSRKRLKTPLQLKRDELTRQFSPLVKEVLAHLREAIDEYFQAEIQEGDCFWTLKVPDRYPDIPTNDITIVIGPTYYEITLEVDRKGNPKYFRCTRIGDMFDLYVPFLSSNSRKSGLSREALIATLHDVEIKQSKIKHWNEKFEGLGWTAFFCFSVIGLMIALVGFNSFPRLFVSLLHPLLCWGTMTITAPHEEAGNYDEMIIACDGRDINRIFVWFLGYFVFSILSTGIFFAFFRWYNKNFDEESD